jgi:hypothetical protein
MSTIVSLLYQTSSISFAQYTEMARATIDSAQKGMETLNDLYNVLSKTITVYAMDTNQSWPYVTYPQWHMVGQTVQSLATVAATAIVVLIQDPIQWTVYSKLHSQDSIPPTVFQIQNDTITPILQTGKYAVNWQMSINPASATGMEKAFVNFNILSLPAINDMLTNIEIVRDGVVSDFVTPPKIKPLFGHSQSTASVFPESMPRSSYGHPIYATLDSDAPIVGLVQAFISWSKYFDNIMLKEKEGIYCVLSNSCNQTRTWFVKAKSADYLGNVSADI